MIALSCGEAEYYGLVRGASQALGMRSVLADFGIDLSVKLRPDSCAAKGIVSRMGLGKVRHAEVAQLWIQDRVGKGEITLEKIDGKKNVADALTKYVNGDQLKKHAEKVGQRVVAGRHKLAPKGVSQQRS